VQLVGKLQVIAAVGDEDAKLAPVGRVGSARWLRSYITGFRRSRTGCVMRDLYHCAPPSPALILAQMGSTGAVQTSMRKAKCVLVFMDKSHSTRPGPLVFITHPLRAAWSKTP